MTTRLYATYTEPERLVAAVRALRERGYPRLEAYTPFPVEGLEEALGLRASKIPMLAFHAGVLAAAATYAVQWFIDAWSYPIDVGARPAHFPLSYVPICFEVGILCASLVAFAGVFAAGKLGLPWHPVFEVPGIESATRDRFWLTLTLAEEEPAQAEEALRATDPSAWTRREEAP